MEVIGKKHILGNNYRRLVIDEISGSIKCYKFKENPDFIYYGEEHDTSDISYLVNSYLINHTLLIVRPKYFIKGKYYIELVSKSGITLDLCLLNTEINRVLAKNIMNKYISDRYNLINDGNYTSIDISESYNESSALIVNDVLKINLIKNTTDDKLMYFESDLLDYLIDDNYKYKYEIDKLYKRRILERNGTNINANSSNLLNEIDKRLNEHYIYKFNNEGIQLKLDMKGRN